MYIPNSFKIEDRATMIEIMRENSFALIVSMVEGEFFGTHVPVLIHDDGAKVRIVGHVAKANPHWKSMADGASVMVVFSGPHAYVSPSNYANKESVPTWNYVAVHAYGAARVSEFKLPMLEEMMDTFDARYQHQWDELSAKYKGGMMDAIVAFEIDVTRIEGKAKLSQNRPRGDRERVADALGASDDASAQLVARLMHGQLKAD